MKLSLSTLAALLTLLLTLVPSPASSGAVSFVSIHKNDGVHGQSSTSYGIQHGPPGQDSAHVEVLRSNKLGAAHSGLRQAPLGAVHSQPVLVAPIQPAAQLLAGGGHVGVNGVAGGPLTLAGGDVGGYADPQADLGGLGGPGRLVGPSGPVGARLVNPGGPLDGHLDGHLDGPLNGPVGLSGSGPGLVRLRDDPANRVGVNGRAPVKDSFPRAALRTVAGTPVWVPSYSKEPPSYEK